MWNELFFYGFTHIPLAAGAGLAFVANNPPVMITPDYDFRWIKSLYWATSGNIRMKFKDSRLGRQLTFTDVALPLVASAFAGQPHILSSPNYIHGGSTYTIEAADASGFANNLRFVMQGANVRSGIGPWERAQGIWKTYRSEEPYEYNSGIITVAAGALLPVTATIENDAPFMIQDIKGQHNGAIGSLLVDIRDSTSQASNWMNIQIPFETVFGTGPFPNIIWERGQAYRNAYRMVGGGNSPATITFNVQNTTPGAINFEISLGGIKLFQ